MGITVRDVGPPLGQAGAPGAEIDAIDFAELDVTAALADTGAAHAGKIGFAGHLERKPAIHDVVPAIPLRQPSRVHRADEIAEVLGGGHKDLLRADAVELGDHKIRQPVCLAIDALGQLGLGIGVVLVGVDDGEFLGQQAAAALRGSAGRFVAIE